MYAVILTGNKQYIIEQGAELKVEKLEGNVGDKVVLNDILFLGGIEQPKIGRPKIEGASVTVEIIKQDRDPKVIVYKRKKRKGFQKNRSHRQPYTGIKVLEIKA